MIDPGIRGERGYKVRDILGLNKFDVLITHFHLDHWIGYKPYISGNLYASQTCIDVLLGRKKTIKIFEDGKLADGHRRPTPLIAVRDAQTELPLKEGLIKPFTEFKPSHSVECYEMPGQTRGMLYVVFNTEKQKILFASDLFIIIKGRLKVEPHYDFETDTRVIDDVILMLKAILGVPYKLQRHYEKEYCGIRRHIIKLQKPELLCLGHGVVRFSEYAKELRALIKGLELRNKLDKKYVI